MRKLLAVVLVLMMILPLVGIGENKYDGMSLNELQAEYTAILKAMWSTDEWQEVEVPSGVYQIGVDIPAGKWTIGGSDEPLIIITKKLDATGTTYDRNSGEFVVSEYVEKDYFPNGWTVTLPDGQYIIIQGIAIFTPPVKGTGFTF